MTDLLTLSDRVEKAEAADRELDAEIRYDVLGICRHARKVRTGAQSDTGFDCLDCGADSWGNLGRNGEKLHDALPAYTASLDAAMSLVPEGCGWTAGWGQTLPDEPMGGARISRNARFAGYEANYDVFAEAEAATPALALVAAALRARHASGAGEG